MALSGFELKDASIREVYFILPLYWKISLPKRFDQIKLVYVPVV